MIHVSTKYAHNNVMIVVTNIVYLGNYIRASEIKCTAKVFKRYMTLQ